MSKQEQNNKEQEQSFAFDFSFPFATVVHGKVDVEHEPMTRKQEQYIQQICNFLDMDFPNVATKDDACAWLEEHVPEYELEIIKSEAFMYAFHEDAVIEAIRHLDGEDKSIMRQSPSDVLLLK